LNVKARKHAKIRKNDQVVLMAGRDKGKRGRVLAVAPVRGKVKVEGAGMIKRHQKPAGNRGGGIIDKEAWIDISNVQIVDPQSGKPSRVSYKIEGDGTKLRVATTSGHSLEK
jgi:large subunit ribosomal protein L24